MPKGRKGGRKQFTNEEELAAQQAEVDRLRESRNKGQASESESGSDSDSGEEGAKGPKGVSHLIETENPNYQVVKAKKVGDAPEKVELSRKEREEIEKQEAKARYDKLHAQGKTDQAQADLARLAIIRAEREEAARKREEERKAKEADKLKAREALAIKLQSKQSGGGGGGKGKKKKGKSGAGDA